MGYEPDLELYTYHQWRIRGRYVRKGEHGHGMNRAGVMTFAFNQTEQSREK